MPRILFVNPGLYAIGGMQAWLDTLMPDLEELGWECWLGLPSGPHNDARAYLANYPWPRLALLENRTGTRVGRLRAIERVLGSVRPELVLVANIVSVYDAIERLRAAGVATPRVAMCTHSNDAGIFGDLARFAGTIDGFVAPNRLIEVAAAEIAGYPVDRIAHAQYGLDVPPPSEPPSAVGWSSLDVVFCARLEESQKRILDLVGIAERLVAAGCDFRLEIIGAGPDEARLRAAVATSPASDRFHFRGAVPPAELLGSVFRPGRVLLVTSAWENGPLVLFQAMVRGMAAVSSRYVGSGREGLLVDDVTCRSFEVGDLEAAAAALASLADPRRRERLASAGREAVAGRYERKRSAAAWDDALRAIVAREIRPVDRAPEPVAPAGRLDRLLGIQAADRVRQLLGRRGHTSGPGDEWPHSQSPAGDAAVFAEAMRRLDRAGDAPRRPLAEVASS